MKKEFTAEEKKAYYAEQKKKVEQSLIAGVNACYTKGNFKNYLDTISKFHDYSIRNCMLIAAQCPEATYVAGYRVWQRDFNRQVKAGEKAIGIIAPASSSKFTVKDVDVDGKEIEKQIQVTRYRVVPVFDVSQTDGEELPTICKPLVADVKDFETIKSKLEQVANVPVKYGETGGVNGYYDRVNNMIMVQEGMPEAQTIKTLAHEIAHSILHNDAFCDIPKPIKEIQAESVAYMVCKMIGIDSDDYSFEYVASWAHEDIDKLMAQMEIVKQTADVISEKLMA